MGTKQNLKQMLERVAVDYICNALAKTGGNVTAAARLLDMPLPTMWWRIKKLGISHGLYRQKEVQR